MSLITRLNDANFVVELVLPNKIGITPAERLTNLQCQWVRQNHAALLSELKERSANDGRRLDRWQWFLSLAAEHGIHPDVVAAEFPTPDDMHDVIEPPEHDDDSYASAWQRFVLMPGYVNANRTMSLAGGCRSTHTASRWHEQATRFCLMEPTM